MIRSRQTSPRFRSRQPSPRGGLALSFATVLFCLLIGEVALRLFDPSASLWRYPNLATVSPEHDPVESAHMRHDEVLGYEPQGSATGTLGGQPVSYSAEGFRNHNLGAPPAEGALILAVGDSFTEGWAVRDDETWPAHLERDIGRRVLNGGVSGYGLDQIVLRAERLAPRFKPRVLVLAFIGDDINRTALASRRWVRKPFFVPVGEALELRNVPVPTTPLHRPFDSAWHVLGYSYLVNFTMHRLGAHALWDGDLYTGVDADLVSCRLMERFAALAARQEAKGIVVAFRNDLTGVGTRDAARLRARVIGALACARRAGLVTLDTHDGFVAAEADRHPEVFYVERHFTDRGNALAAKLIATVLEEPPIDRRHPEAARE